MRQREPRVRDPDYLAWLAGAPCVACFMEQGRMVTGVHCAHVRYADAAAGKRATGMAEKPSDRWCLPLCPTHHNMGGQMSQHAHGERAWWEARGLDPLALCEALNTAYERHTGPAYPVIAQFVGAARRGRPARDYGL